MPKKFLHRLLGQTASVPPEVEGALEELSRLEQERPALAASASVLREVLPLLFEKPATEAVPVLTPDQAAVKLQGGVPLLRGERVALDISAFRRRWLGVCQAVGRQRHDDAPKTLADLLRSGRLQPEEMMFQTLSGQPQLIHARMDTLGGDADLCTTVLRLTLFPVLSQLSRAMEPALRGTAWPHGHCPVCGSWPLLGEFRGLEQTRFLRCGLCSAEWEYPRLRCAFCGNGDHRTLGYIHAEGEENRYRAVACEECRGYVKMVSTLQALPGPGLLVADLATMHLDLVLAERGYGILTG